MSKISYLRGTTYTMTFNYTPAAGEAAGATCLFTVKTQIDDDATDTTNAVMPPKNITMAANTCNIVINPSDVADTIDAATNYVYDIRVIDTAGKIFPGSSGTFELDVSATNRIA